VKSAGNSGKKREYLKDKIDELATNSKNKNIRDLYMLGGSLVTTAWRVLRLRMEGTASRYGG
jgi:hypothetical protein